MAGRVITAVSLGGWHMRPRKVAATLLTIRSSLVLVCSTAQIWLCCGALRASVGQAVGLQWLPEQAHLFDPKRRLRLS